MDAPTAKRKRSATDTRPGDAPAPAPAAAVDEVSDAEVEEFYAILYRMRDASRRLLSGAGAGAPPPPTPAAWWPSFSREDFETAPPTPAATPAPRVPDERVAENATLPRRQPGRLDLNAEPEPEAPAAAPATPRPERATA